ncbi:MAG: ABC transporter ATP-binding protein [Elusimicrobiota bacterium]|jgi:iron(III) transport system ATP-binding protein|nr:ABC transporter ATP-binding protein [Elusimicrobiota bacterium]
MATIKIENVFKAYEDNQVHKDLTLTINDGECFTLLGPSGCGKSVLLRMIAGFEMPDKGRIYIGDKLVADSQTRTSVPPNQRDLGVVFQDYAVWPHMSVFDNIAYPLKIAKQSKETIQEKVMNIVHLVGLDKLETRMPSQLSGGQQQRVALGRALVGNPSLMLLDEPLNNLDANLREEMRFEIKDLQKKLGITIFYVTHDQEIALAISDRIAIMNEKGKIFQIGTPVEIFEQPVNDFIFKFLGVSNFLPIKQRDGELFVGSQKFNTQYPPTLKAKELMAAFRPSDVSVSRSSGAIVGKVIRSSFLGADMDYLIKVESEVIRTQLNTYDALQKNLIFKEGEECFINFNAISWFDKEQMQTGHEEAKR